MDEKNNPDIDWLMGDCLVTREWLDITAQAFVMVRWSHVVPEKGKTRTRGSLIHISVLVWYASTTAISCGTMKLHPRVVRPYHKTILR